MNKQKSCDLFYDAGKSPEVMMAVRVLLAMKSQFLNSDIDNARVLSEMFQKFAEEVEELA